MSSSSDLSSGASDSDEEFGAPVAIQSLPTVQIQSLRIRDHVMATLDFEKENYGLWRREFLAALAKFGLTHHVDGSPAQATSDWVLADFAILSWYNATVTPSTLEIVADRKDKAYTLWRSLRSLFRSNRDARITYLLDEFHSFIQGELSVVDYTAKLKQMADTLRDLGHRIKDRDLVHNVPRGLDERFQHAVPHMTSGRRPSFIKLRVFLQLEEQPLALLARVNARSARLARASAFYAPRPSSSTPPPPRRTTRLGLRLLPLSPPPSPRHCSPPTLPPWALLPAAALQAIATTDRRKGSRILPPAPAASLQAGVPPGGFPWARALPPPWPAPSRASLELARPLRLRLRLITPRPRPRPHHTGTKPPSSLHSTRWLCILLPRLVVNGSSTAAPRPT